ncbi:MAG: bi-domain-containing oxidoreductase [Candidatus Eremiobacteraeota bacterium]|nr:bi-domain-containing oxidoreductase [Candidatus Eremiobacteraeota bacterium]
MKQLFQSLRTGALELAELPVPQARAGHLLIRTRRSVISLGTERMLLDFGRAGWIEKARQQPDRVRQVLEKIKTDGILPTVQAVQSKLDQPITLGYSQAGEVIAAGSGVEGFRAGDRVISNGPHGEIVSVPATLCALIPPGVDDDTAAFTVIAAIALQGVRLISPTLGESVAVMGLGLIGLLTCQILGAHGCRVLGFDPDEKKADHARRFGAEAYALTESLDAVGIAHAFSSGYGVDGVIITASTKSNDPIHMAPRMCRPRGRVILVGVVGLALSRDDFYRKEISFQVSCSYGPGRYQAPYEKKGLDYPIGFVRWTEQRNFEAVLQLMKEKKLVTESLVTARSPFGSALDAYENVSGGTDMLGIMLDYDAPVDTALKVVPLGVSQASGKAAAPVIGFIGAGSFASSTLIPAFRETGARLKIIASAGGMSGYHAGRKFGFEAVTTDHRALLDDSEINAVVIATQHDSHGALVMEALRAGKHVFVEKPLCIKREELEALDETYRSLAEKPLLMVGFNRRFAPLTVRLREILSGFREPGTFVMTVNAGSLPADHWTLDGEAGGGRLIGEGCHFIDLIRFCAGSPLAEVQSFPGGASAAPGTVSLFLRCTNGSQGFLHYLTAGHKSFPKERLEVICGGAVLVLDNFRSLAGFGVKGFSREKPMAQDKGHGGCARAFVEAVEKGLPSPIPFEELVEVTDATFRAAGL